jgi:transposase
MLGKQERNTALFQCVTMEQLVPERHVLRRLNAALDLSFVRAKVADLYSARGRQSFDPEVVVRMWVLQHFYGYSEREICDEVTMHAGFRWFCGLSFNDPVPDQSTLVKLRKNKWAKSDLWQTLLDETVRACEAAGLSRPGAGQRLGVDGTQITANAATSSLEALPATETPAAPEASEEPAVQLRVVEGGTTVATTAPPEAPSAPPAPRQSGDPEWHGERFSNATHRSTTDPEARLYRKSDCQEAKLRYLGHYLADLQSGVIYGAMATQATGTGEREAALALLDRLPQLPAGLAADLGYRDGDFLADVLKRGVQPFVPLGAEPLEEVPTYQRRTFDTERLRKRLAAQAAAKARNATRLAARTRAGKQAQRQRTRLEHLFGEAKEHHGLGRAHGRGLTRVDQQVKLTACVQNIKRLLKRRRRLAAEEGLAATEAPTDTAETDVRQFLRLVNGGRQQPARPSVLDGGRRAEPLSAQNRRFRPRREAQNRLNRLSTRFRRQNKLTPSKTRGTTQMATRARKRSRQAQTHHSSSRF